jgi:hypothetical protein
MFQSNKERNQARKGKLKEEENVVRERIETRPEL